MTTTTPPAAQPTLGGPHAPLLCPRCATVHGKLSECPPAAEPVAPCPPMDAMSSFNQLTPAQAERLAMLAEECAEVIQVVGKTLRHGYASHNPNKPNEGSNVELLRNELNDVFAVVQMLAQDIGGLIATTEATHTRIQRKLKYSHHQ